MATGSAKVQSRSHFTALLLVIMGAIAALVLACGATGAWADEEDEVDSFDSVADVSENAGEANEATPEAQEGAAIADEAILEAFPGVAFDKKEMKVKVGTAYLVGFAPEASDAKSDDKDRVTWHESWKEAVESSNIDLTDESGWLKGKNDEDEEIDYSGITGIVTEDKEIFELLGEFPDWKVDDEGTEYRWWYGLLGVAKKTGDTKLQIVFRDADGVNHVLDECTVHVVEAEETNVRSATKNADVKEEDAVSEPQPEQNAEATDAVEDDDVVDDVVDDGAQTLGSQSSTSVSISTAANSSDSAASADKSGASTSTSANESSGSSTNGSSTTSNSNTNASGYPKEIFKTLQGAKIAGSLLARDSNAEKALASLGSSTDLHLAIEVKTQLGEAAEKALSTLATNNGVSVCERLSVKVLDTNNAEATISGMNLTVKVAADDAIKKLDASSVQVWYVSEEGSTEKTTAKLSNGYLSFDTTHLSDFVVMGKASSSSSSSSSGKSGMPQTGDNMAYLAIVLAFVAGFSASSALNARRRMKE